MTQKIHSARRNVLLGWPSVAVPRLMPRRGGLGGPPLQYVPRCISDVQRPASSSSNTKKDRTIVCGNEVALKEHLQPYTRELS